MSGLKHVNDMNMDFKMDLIVYHIKVGANHPLKTQEKTRYQLMDGIAMISILINLYGK